MERNSLTRGFAVLATAIAFALVMKPATAQEGSGLRKGRARMRPMILGHGRARWAPAPSSAVRP